MPKPPPFVADYSATGQVPDQGRLDAPPFHRNHEPIWNVLRPFLGEREGEVLEVGSGTGQHVAAFARRSPKITWCPSDHIDAHLASIAAWREHNVLANIADPQRIDLSEASWAQALGSGRFLAIVCINVLHISPWAVSQHLFDGATRILRPGGRLFIYGPFKRDGRHIAPSNAEFDASLRAKNADWGVRDVAELNKLGEAGDMALADVVAMPANNFTLVFERRSP